MADFVTQAILTANVANFLKGMQDANKSYDDLVSKSSKGADGTVSAWDKAGIRMKTIGAVMTVGLSTPLVSFASKTVQAAADAQAMESQFEQTFGNMAGFAQKSLDAIVNETGMLPNRIKPSFSLLTGFAKTAGMDTAEALGVAERATRAAADSAAYYDRSMEDATDSIMSFLKGNYANDAALGISCTETTRNAAANKLYGQSFKNLSEAQKQLTLLQMVEDGNRLSGALGQAARESDGLTNVMGNMKQAFTDASAELGKELLPVVTDVIKGVTDMVKGFSELPEGAKKGVVGFGVFVAAAGPLLTTGGKVIDIFQKLGRQKAAETALEGIGGAAKSAAEKIGFGAKAGLVGAGIALAVVIGKTLYDAMTSVTPEAKKLRDEVNGLKNTFADQTTEIKATAEANKSMVDMLDKVIQAEGKSEAGKAKIKAIVDQLNASYSDLNLSYDEETGALSKTVDALYDYIDAQRKKAEETAKAKAYQDALRKQYETEAELINTQIELEIKRNKHKEEGNSLNFRLRGEIAELERSEQSLKDTLELATQVTEKHAAALGAQKDSANQASIESQRLQNAVAEATAAQDTAAASAGQLTEYQRETIEQFRALGGEYASMSDAQILAVQDEINASNEKLDKLSKNEQALVDAYKATHEEAIAMTDQYILTLAEREEEARAQREESYKAHLERMNGALIEQQQVDLETLTQNMQANAQTMEAYYANRLEIQERMQGQEYDGLREWLLSLGAENTNALDEILGMTDEQLKEYAATFQRNMNAAAVYADEETMNAVANISNQLQAGGVRVGEDATELNRAVIAAFADLGEKLDLKSKEGIEAFAAAIAANSGLAADEAKKLKLKVMRELSRENLGDGTSAKSAGAKDAGDFGKGIEEKIPEIGTAAMRAKQKAVDGLDDKGEGGKKGGQLGKGFTDTVDGAALTASVVGIHVGTQAVSGLNTGVFNGTAGSPDAVGQNLSQGFANGIQAGQSAVVNSAISVAQSAINAMQNALQIRSPSKVFEKLGEYTSLGFAQGAGNMIDQVQKTFGEISNAAIDSIDQSAAVPGSTKQPALINLQLGSREFKAFVSDIFGTKDAAQRLEDAYAL